MSYNPRFPHKLRLLIPVHDGNGEPAFDENGDIEYETLQLQKVVMDSDDNPILDEDGEFRYELVDEIEWGYRTSTGGFRDSGEVAEADFKIATPMFVTPLNTGDILEMTDYDRTWRMEVLKKTTYNWGTNIWVKDVKN